MFEGLARPSLTVLSDARAEALRPLLRALAKSQSLENRLTFDPVEVPRRYAANAADVEVAGLIAAMMAYGRASVFKPRVEQVLRAMGPHPAAFAKAFALAPNVAHFRHVRYRFNEPADFAALVAAIGSVIAKHGGLGVRLGELFSDHDLRTALALLVRELREAPAATSVLKKRGTRGFYYLLPDPSAPGASKRWHLYLRWMVRGPDSVDLGVWRGVVPKSAPMIPLDTHIARIAVYLGLTDRTDLSWTTAEDITASLRRIDHNDPVRFDFALCHHGMSGQCPAVQTAASCAKCILRSECRAAKPSA